MQQLAAQIVYRLLHQDRRTFVVTLVERCFSAMLKSLASILRGG